MTRLRFRAKPEAWTLLPLVIGVMALGACFGGVQKGWEPTEADLVGTWTSETCDAELVFADDGTLAYRNFTSSHTPPVTGEGTWSVDERPRHALYVHIDGVALVRLTTITRNGQPIVLNIVGDPDNGDICEYVRDV